MQLSGIGKSLPTLAASDTSTTCESSSTMIQDSSSQSAGMFDVAGSAAMPFNAGPLSANPVMAFNDSSSPTTTSGGKLSGGSNNSSSSSTFDKSAPLKHDAATLVASDDSSSYDKYSIGNSCSAEKKAFLARPAGRMLTQTSILEIPRSAKYYDLAWFLRHTGPDGIYESPKRTGSTSKGAFRFFKKANKTPAREPVNAVSEAHKDLNDVLLFDKGGLLLPEGVEQKVTLTGTPYLAVKVGSDKKIKLGDNSSSLSKNESSDHKSDATLAAPVNVADRHMSEISTLTASEWFLKYDGRAPSPVSPIATPEPIKQVVKQANNTTTTQAIDLPASPVRPAASNPPTPPQEKAAVIAESYKIDLTDHPAKYSVDFTGTERKQSKDAQRKPVTPMPTLVLRDEEFPVNIPRPGRECDMQHPSPRRLASHPLLNRTSTLVEASMPRSATQSPGTPPPKSPLRLRRDNRTIERSPESDTEEPKTTTKTAPVILPPDEFAKRRQVIVPTVTTVCTGPLTKTTHSTVKHMLYPASKKEREERIRTRKIRDRPNSMVRTIDTVVNGTPASPRQRLRKARPQSKVPSVSSLKPAPLVTRTPPKQTTAARASSRQFDVSNQHSRGSSHTTVDTPESMSLSGSPTGDSRVHISSGMLVAEEIPLPKAKSPFRPARIVVAKERVYTPRPRSASMPRSTGKRRSRNSVSMPSRVMTPEMPKDDSQTPPLPSPPPNRALPPTPPASGSEKITKKSKIPAPYAVPPLLAPARDWPLPPMAGKSRQYIPSQKGSSPPSQTCEDVYSLQSRNTYLEKRNAHVEKHNRLLSAALMAVLNSNGESNMPLNELLGQNSPKYSMTWEDRVTRRSEASHTTSSSNGSALDFYLSTKRGSKVTA